MSLHAIRWRQGSWWCRAFILVQVDCLLQQAGASLTATELVESTEWGENLGLLAGSLKHVNQQAQIWREEVQQQVIQQLPRSNFMGSCSYVYQR